MFLSIIYIKWIETANVSLSILIYRYILLSNRIFLYLPLDANQIKNQVDNTIIHNKLWKMCENTILSRNQIMKLDYFYIDIHYVRYKLCLDEFCWSEWANFHSSDADSLPTHNLYINSFSTLIDILDSIALAHKQVWM